MGVAVAVAGYFFVLPLFTQNQEPEVPANEDADDMSVCIQVVTPARNPDTGQIKEFPTPCDVPEGWEVIINDVPGLDDY